jgi:hypothetical protein
MTNTRSNGGLLFLLCLCAVCTVLVIGMQRSPIADIDDLLDIPMTDHAKNKVLAGEYSVAEIMQQIQQRKCHPIYALVCPSRDALIYVCPVREGSKIWIGLIIGYSTPMVITAYPAPQAWWEALAVRDNCNPPDHRMMIMIP